MNKIDIDDILAFLQEQWEILYDFCLLHKDIIGIGLGLVAVFMAILQYFKTKSNDIRINEDDTSKSKSKEEIVEPWKKIPTWMQEIGIYKGWIHFEDPYNYDYYFLALSGRMNRKSTLDGKIHFVRVLVVEGKYESEYERRRLKLLSARDLAYNLKFDSEEGKHNESVHQLFEYTSEEYRQCEETQSEMIQQ
tara:strand:+ start:912 stop:1487 length:576 start_codon:yes stop_codon:yes gene_type:complete